ncbi:allergen Tab y 5.0101 [Drosophila novamexicana]|uniref:allergen Tab y 5.0101 n=1 Tax=Drosophila novamexicana TaxID=47314 RepID=UPI0011E5C9B5|nr:allergen Tab y 5.0101 [Drosophila novamexicana]
MQRQHLLLASTVILGLARITALPNSCLTPSDKLEAPDYCLEHQPHFACESEEEWAGKCGKPRKFIELTPALIRRIVRQHNVYRNMVAKGNMARLPAASRMMLVAWDPILADLAKLAVMRCTIDPIGMSLSTTQAARPGYNAVFSKYPKHQQQDVLKILNSHLKAWYDQYYYVNLESLLTGKSAGGQDISHFLQLMTGSNTRVGCSIASFHEGLWKYQLMICLYGCNKQKDQFAYRIGKTPGDSCACGTDRQYKNLCRPENHNGDCSLKKEDDDDIAGPITTTTTTTKKPKENCKPGTMQSVLDWLWGF